MLELNNIEKESVSGGATSYDIDLFGQGASALDSYFANLNIETFFVDFASRLTTLLTLHNRVSMMSPDFKVQGKKLLTGVYNSVVTSIKNIMAS